MRVKKQRHHRRAVRFYTACFGFRQPFKVFCDGTFVHHLLANGITPADTALANTLGAPVKLFTSRCVAVELRSLGHAYSNSFNVACNLLTARCDHERRKSAVACIAEIIGENNRENFFVATQDAELREKLRKIPGVPLVYALRNALFLESPSAFQREYAKTVEEKRSHMTDMEYRMLEVTKKRVATEEGRDTFDANEANEDDQLRKKDPDTVKRNGMVMKDKVQFKRKIAKGPNPLSCKTKKPKLKVYTDASLGQVKSTSVDNSVEKKKRIRRRKKKSIKSNNDTL